MSNNSGGFFAGLFDFSFTKFVTPRLVAVLYVIGIIGTGIAALGIIIAGFANGFGAGIASLIAAPIIFFIYLLFLRVGLETLIIAFKNAESNRQIAENTRGLGSGM
jgi:ABC-type multidrug transport system permease subunit